MRPTNCWNFFEDSVVKTPHVLRAEAKPQACYIDGRIEALYELIEEIGYHVKSY